MSDEAGQTEATPSSPKATLEDVLASMESTNQTLSRTAAAFEAQSQVRQAAPAPVALPDIDPYEGQDPTTFDGVKLQKYVEHKAEVRAKKLLEKELAPIRQGLELQNQQEQYRRQQEIGREIEEVRKANPDFKEAAPIIARLAKEHPTLNVKQLYKLAKEELPSKPEAKKPVSMGSEKPTHSAARPPAKIERAQPLPRGRNGFSQLIRESFSRRSVPAK
jgi:hypothetical protein